MLHVLHPRKLNAQMVQVSTISNVGLLPDGIFAIQKPMKFAPTVIKIYRKKVVSTAKSYASFVRSDLLAISIGLPMAMA